MRRLLALKGLRDTDYQVKELVGTPVRFDCLKRGECDAVPLGQPGRFDRRPAGLSAGLAISTEAIAAFQFQVIAARRALAQANKDAWCVSCARSAQSFRFIREPANRGEVIKAMMELTGSSDDIARKTLALYLEPDRGVLPRAAEIDLKGLAQVIAFMGRAV